MLIDTHTHFYDEWLLPDADEAVARALEAGVGKMVQADVDSSERDALWAVNDRHPGVLCPMVGLYPCSVKEDWKEEIDRMLPYRKRGVVAVGEIGLDYHEGDEDRDLQKEALRVQLELASEWDLPVNIHLRDAWGDLFTILEDCRHLHLRGVLHCFSGSWEVYDRARRCGDFSVGIGGVVTFKKASLAETVKRIPLEHIVLETDAPYLAPVPYRGKRNESAFLPLVAAKVAELKGLTFAEVEAATTHNAETLYQL
jgi:TatD DNase family protein